MKELKFSILIPTYNGEKVIDQTLRSILSQDYSNYEIIISDDFSKDNTIQVIKAFKDSRIKIFINNSNLGYPENLNIANSKASGEIIYLMGQDDILSVGALLNTHKAFMLDRNIGAVIRPYYQFYDDIKIPVRNTGPQLNPLKNEVLHITDDYDKIILIIHNAGQLSGLAMRKKYMDLSFHSDIFPCHVYPFISIFKKHPIVFLKDYTVAVRITSSQARNVSSIYDISPIETWINFFNNVFYEKEFQDLKKYCIQNYVLKNYVGLVQIKNYSKKYVYLLREIYTLIKYRWQNILHPLFWFYSFITLILPKTLLIPLTDWYKNTITSKTLTKIKFVYNL